MTELELSVMFTNDEAIAALRLALQDFEAREQVRVNLRVFSWQTAWSELVRVALYRSGPDVSEVGTTWIDSFVSLNALRPFLTRELISLGGPNAFLPSSWRSAAMLGQTQVWAIPWLADTRVVYYRRDLLEKAGVDESIAFASADRFWQTLQRLQEQRVEIPLVIPTAHRNTLHIMASWVWQAGGHFTSADGKRVVFNTAEARAGQQAFFNLRRFLTPLHPSLSDPQSGEMFRQGQAAVLISGSWVMKAIIQRVAHPDVYNNLGMAVMPTVPYVGGSNLVVWKHSRQPEAAIALARYLTGQLFQTNVVVKQGLLPARLDILLGPPFTTDPYYRVMGESLRQGRGFQASYMWGLIEDKLSETLTNLWHALLTHPSLEVAEAMAQYLEPLAEELNQSLVA